MDLRTFSLHTLYESVSLCRLLAEYGPLLIAVVSEHSPWRASSIRRSCQRSPCTQALLIVSD